MNKLKVAKCIVAIFGALYTDINFPSPCIELFHNHSLKFICTHKQSCDGMKYAD